MQGADGPILYAMEDCDHHPVADFSCNHTCRTEAEMMANARMAAASHQMLAALQRVLSDLHNEHTRGFTRPIETRMDEVRAAIKEATGQ